jgi:uncharacterized protein with von Willebrand factor type A (vWA) domain
MTSGGGDGVGSPDAGLHTGFLHGVFLHNLIVFGRMLRRAGLDVHTGRLQDLAEALQHINLAVRDEVYHTCRTLLIHRREDITTFDAVFDAFWRDHSVAPPGLTGPPSQRSRSELEASSAGLDTDAEASGENAAEPKEDEEEWQTWSDASTLAHKDFSDFTAEEMAIAQTALDRLTWTPGMRKTRRWVRGRGARVDVRLAIARSLRTGGDVVRFPREKRRLRPRPLVLLCDVSGSMERYSRLLLHFAHAMTRQQGHIEVFLFSTRLTNITADLKTRGLDPALSRVSQSVQDWSGGTRIGDALRQLNTRWSRRVLVRGPVVLIISDGWDRGDPAVIRTEISRLQRSCHRLIWLNPLIGTTDYAPLTRGLQAALPFVHDFMPVRTLTNLADLAVHLNALDR